MSVPLFTRVLTHLRACGYTGDFINLYNWGDPLLHPELGAVLEVCEANHYRPIVSTNLSFPEARVRSLAEHNVDLLLVSMSGFSQETYGKNHVGGDFALIRQNLARLRGNRGRIQTIVLKYLVFEYNRDDLEHARTFAEEAGFEFGAYMGAIPSAESFFMYQQSLAYRRAVEAYIAPNRLALRPARFCPQETTVTINHHAQLDRCCVSWGNDTRAAVFDADLRKHLDEKTTSAFCRRCLASGYSYYKHFGNLETSLLPALGA